MLTHSDVAKRSIRGRIVVLVVFALLLYIVVPQIDSFSDSLQTLKTVEWLPVATALALTVITFFVAAGTYHLLALKRLRYTRTVLVQGASAFANRILPAGLGGLTLNVQYLRKNRYSLPQAVAVAGINNILGLVGHMVLLLGVVALARDDVISHLALSQWGGHWYWLVAAAGLMGIALFAATGLRKSLLHIAHTMFKQLLLYRKYKVRVVLALMNSVGLTLLYVGIFYLSAQALDANIGFLQALIVFSAGMLLGTVTPTPGGLGGVEAGLAAGMVAYNQEPSLALAVTLLYRLLTYWVPLLPGFLIFMTTRKLYS